VLRIQGRLVPVGEHEPLGVDDLERLYRQVTSAEQQTSFEREKELDLAYEVPGVARFRVNVGRQRQTITMVMRCLSAAIPALNELMLPPVCRELIARPRGLILVTGPTGSGKTTTLAAMIEHVNQRSTRRIITCEDPIEYVFEDKRCFITQRELGDDTLSFASALRHALRQDPDVILVGEMRDLDTISTALTAAETGHLVLSTLHTAGAAQTVDRIIDVFPPHRQQQTRVMLANILEGVLSQTLVPTIDGRGRVAAGEVMTASSAVRNILREGKTHQLPGLIETSQRMGMRTLDQALVELFRRRLISRDQMLANATDPAHVRTLIGSG